MRDDDSTDRFVTGRAAPAEITEVLPVVEGDEPPLPPASGDGTDRRMVLGLVAAGLALIVAAAVAVIALWPGGDDNTSTAQPGAGVTLRPATPSAPVVTPSGSPSPHTSASASATPSSTPSRTPVSSAPASASPGAPPASATLAPPPATDRSEVITGAGGHCLDVRGGIALPGGAVSAYACNSTLSQRWTLAADGTLRVSGMCATPDGTAVHLAGCDASAQWRAGSNGTLVNVSTAQCLTDPTGGTRTGERMTLAGCGGSGQSWTLP